MSLMVEWPALMASTLASGSLAAVHVDADHGKTRLGKGHGQGQTDITQANDSDGSAVAVEFVEEGLFCVGGHGRQNLRRRNLIRNGLVIRPAIPVGRYRPDAECVAAILRRYRLRVDWE